MTGKYNILLLGSGGREHALAWKMAQSPALGKLWIAPGNAGTSLHGENVNISETNFPELRDFAISNEVNMIVVGPEAPLVAGIFDFFQNDPLLKDILFIGPSAAGAMLEGSKDFAKSFMQKHGIPTAAYKTFDIHSLSEAKEFLKTLQAPYVLKADGLAAGKGVLICDSLENACAGLDDLLLHTRFGKASEKVVIEEFLPGIEMSAFVLTDGNSYVILPEAKDYKRIGDGDTGPNTGGMGCVSPVPFYTPEFRQKVETRIIKPTINGLNEDKIPFTGFVFFGLMNVNGDPFVIEYNCRLGDPETEVILPRIESDIIALFEAAATHTLNQFQIRLNPETAVAVMLVSKGYPGDYAKGETISGLDSLKGAFPFHAGTRAEQETNIVITNGGRVMALMAMDKTIESARNTVYQNVKNIHFDGMNFRSDIGLDLMNLTIE
jgi:phosphoribosylamine--glycine ligase